MQASSTTLTTELSIDIQMMDIKLSYRDIASNKIPTSDLPMDCAFPEEDIEDLDDNLVNLLVEDKNLLYAP